MTGSEGIPGHHRGHPELARPYFEQQAQFGRRVIFRWNPAKASPHNPLTTPWPTVEELIEGVKFADEVAARRFNLDRTIGLSGRQADGDVTDAGPWYEFLSWEEAEAWLHAGEGEHDGDQRAAGVR